LTVGKWIGVISFVVALLILWKIRQVLLLAFAAVVFATVINRLVRQFQKVKVPRKYAVPISVLLILAVLAGIIGFVAPSLSQQWQQLTDLVPQGLEQLRSWYDWLQNLIPGQLLTDIGSLRNLAQRLTAESGWFEGFLKVFSNSLDFVLNLFLVIVVIIMLLLNPQAYRQVFILLFPSFYRQRVDEILSKCEENLIGWVIGILFNMTVITILSGLGLWLLGVKLAFVNAIIAGFLTFIPNLGPTISVIPPAALALLDAPWKAVAVVILYIVIQQIESDILTPMIMKHEVSLLPAITLFSQVIFAVFFGLLGLFLALPIVVILQVWFKELLIKDILNHWSLEDSQLKFLSQSKNS
jgi:predicted PurR-regulated permease PerM